MDQFHYRDRDLYCEDISVGDLAAKYGTPLYVYSQAAIVGSLRALQTAFAELSPLVCYSVKANSNLSILKVMAEAGSGFDVVSGGELYRVQKAGGDPGRTVFAGVGKTDEEIKAGLDAGVLMFNVESEAELDAIVRVATAAGKVAPLALRVNPDVDPKTHRYISTGKKESKFGMDIDRSLALGQAIRGNPHVSMIGVHMHIGSQITTTDPYAGAAGKAVTLIEQFRAMGHPIGWFNMGGGFGINYRGTEAKVVSEFASVVVPAIKQTGCRLAMEPGRVIAGNAGILVSRVLYTKQSGEKRFLIQDAAMNDLIRPALYESFHRIWPVSVPAGLPAPPVDYEAAIAGTEPWDVVGPVCESGDFLAKDRALPRLDRGDLLAVFSAGAYGMVMASNYNTRPRAAEILVDGSTPRLARRRETYEDLVEQELAALGAARSLGMIRFVPSDLPKVRAFRLALAIVSIAIVARTEAVNAQVPGVESFVRAPKTPLDFWEIADYLVRTHQPAQAVPFLQKFEAANPDDATLIRLHDEYGDASVMRLIDSAATRPFADRLIKRMADARRKFANDPVRIASAIAGLSKSPEERNLAIERLREAGAHGVPPVLRALSDPAITPETRKAIVSGLGSLGSSAVHPLLAALDSPDLAPDAATALGQIGDPRAVPRLTALAMTTGKARDLARQAVARITGVAFESQPRPPIRVILDAAWRSHNAVAHLPSEPATEWVWDANTKAVVARTTTYPIVESDTGLALARAAVAISPDDRDAQIALLSLALDRDPATAAPIALAAGPGLVSDVARRAVVEGRPMIAVSALSILGKIANRDSLGDASRPNIFVEALASPYRRVQFAAAEALVGLDPRRSFPGSSLVVPTLARFVTPAPIPRAIVIDGNAARGSQVVGFLKLIGYDAQLALRGDDGFRLAAEMADVELITIDPDLVQGPWRLHDTLANLRADARTAGIPIFLVGPLYYRDKYAAKLEGFPNVRYLVTPTETALFKDQVDRGLAAYNARPLSTAERNDYATRAAALLARIAVKPGNPFEPDLAVAGPALSIALNSPATAPAALKVLADIPKSDAQRGLADVLINPASPVDLRLAAADGLAKSIRHFGPLLATRQEVQLVEALDRETDPALRTALATVVGALKPRPAASSRRLQAFQPADSVAR